jgi:hypothetical protein
LQVDEQAEDDNENDLWLQADRSDSDRSTTTSPVDTLVRTSTSEQQAVFEVKMHQLPQQQPAQQQHQVQEPPQQQQLPVEPPKSILKADGADKPKHRVVSFGETEQSRRTDETASTPAIPTTTNPLSQPSPASVPS